MLKESKIATIYYFFTIICVVAFMLRDAWYYAITVNYFGFFILILELGFLILIFQRSAYTRLAIICWSLLFLVKGSLPIIGMVLEHSYNQFVHADMSTLTKRIFRLSLTLIVFTGVFFFTSKDASPPEANSIQDLEP